MWMPRRFTTSAKAATYEGTVTIWVGHEIEAAREPRGPTMLRRDDAHVLILLTRREQTARDAVRSAAPTVGNQNIHCEDTSLITRFPLLAALFGRRSSSRRTTFEYWVRRSNCLASFLAFERNSLSAKRSAASLLRTSARASALPGSY